VGRDRANSHLRVELTPHDIAPDQPEHEPDRRHDEVVDGRHQHLRKHEADRERQDHQANEDPARDHLDAASKNKASCSTATATTQGTPDA
jgi:hypothetical protein